jgi:hypothetical protein
MADIDLSNVLYTINPSTPIQFPASTILQIIAIFAIYLLVVGYLASYDIAYKPNFNMFVNFVFDNYDGHGKFFKYIHSVKNSPHHENFEMRTAAPVHPESDASLPPSTSQMNVSEKLEQLQNSMYFLYNKLLLAFYTKGNKIKFYRPV